MAGELLLSRGRHGQVGVEDEPRLDLRGSPRESETELVDVAADPALGGPWVLERLDVVEDADRRAQPAVFVAVTIATVSWSGARSAICSSIVTHEVASDAGRA